MDNNKKDIFAPPSEEELAMFSAPSKEELSNFSNDPAKMSASQIEEADKAYQAEIDARENEALLAGAAQGSTFGFSDELGATKDVVVDAFTGNKLGKSWRDLQKAREAANKKLAEESPWAYGAGEVIGGVGSSIVLPPMGAAKVASTASRFSPAIGKFLAGQSEGALARIAGKGTTMAIQGAPVGLAYGVGASENDISQPIELAKDALSGAGMGAAAVAAIGGGGQVIKRGVKGLGSIVKDSNYARAVKEGFNFGNEQGVNLGSGRDQETLTTLSDEFADSFVQKIFKTDEQLGKNVGAAINKAQADGIKINIDPKISEVSQKIYKTMTVDNPALEELLDAPTKKTLKAIKDRELGNLTPIEARAFKDYLYKLSDKLKGRGSDTSANASGWAKEIAKEISLSLKKSIPAYETAAEQFKQFRRLVPETILSKGTPVKYNKVYLGDLKNPDLKLLEATSDVISYSQLPGESKEAQRKTFEMLKRNLKELDSSNPNVAKNMEGSSEQVIAMLRKQSDKIAAMKIAQGVDPQAGVQEAVKSSLGMVSTTGKGIGVSVPNKVGLVTKAVRESSPVKMSKAVFDTTEKGLYTLSDKLKANQATAILGDSLENALNNKNEAGKNAVLFKLMQNPEYRNILREEGVSEEE